MKNSKMLLLLLAVVLAVSLYSVWQDMLPTKRLDGESVAVFSTDQDQAVTPGNRLDFTGGIKRKFRKPKRNLFGRLFPPPPVVVKTVTPVMPVQPIVIPKAAVPAPVLTEVVSPVRSPMPKFLVLGFLEKSDVITVFLSFQGEIHLLKQGQMFADEFRVNKIDDQQMTITRLQGAGEVTLTLNDKKGPALMQVPTMPKQRSRSTRGIVRPGSPGVPSLIRNNLKKSTPLVKPRTLPSMPGVHPPFNGAN